MKNNCPLIKICGIKDLETTREAISFGVHFIGLVLYEKSKRFIPISLADEISAMVKQLGAIPVAVFVDKNAKEITNICKSLGVNHVQLYGNSKKEHSKLKDNIHRIYVKQVSSNGVIKDKNDEMKLDKYRDFILYDGMQPGSGEGYLYHSLKINPHFRYFIAGGLNKNNIHSLLTTHRPYGVDISTGVENSDGRKDKYLISEFIRKVRMYHDA